MNIRKNKLTREICITGVENGYIISVGCKKFVVTTIDDLLLELREYLHNPERRESELFPDMPQPSQVFKGIHSPGILTNITAGGPEMGGSCEPDE